MSSETRDPTWCKTNMKSSASANSGRCHNDLAAIRRKLLDIALA